MPSLGRRQVLLELRHEARELGGVVLGATVAVAGMHPAPFFFFFFSLLLLSLSLSRFLSLFVSLARGLFPSLSLTLFLPR